jgi:hypothetical protein
MFIMGFIIPIIGLWFIGIGIGIGIAFIMMRPSYEPTVATQARGGDAWCFRPS